MANFKIYSRENVSDTFIMEVVRFILQYGNVRTFSWGFVDKFISRTEASTLQNLQYTTTKSFLGQMLNETILKNHEEGSITNPEYYVNRTIFFQKYNAMTSSEEIIVGSIDYSMSL